MTSPRNWTQRELDGIFNACATQIELLARELTPVIDDVNMAVDPESRKPVIRFVFRDSTAREHERLPENIDGHRVVSAFRR